MSMINEGDLTKVTLNLGAFRRRLNFLMKGERMLCHIPTYELKVMFDRGERLEQCEVHKLIVPHEQFGSWVFLFDDKECFNYTFWIPTANIQNLVTTLEQVVLKVSRAIKNVLLKYTVVVENKLDPQIDEVLAIVEGKEMEDGND